MDKKSHNANSQNVITTIVDIIPPGTFFGQDSLNEIDKLYTYNVISDSFSELYFAYNAEFLPLLTEYSYYNENIFKIENILKQEIKEYEYIYKCYYCYYDLNREAVVKGVLKPNNVVTKLYKKGTDDETTQLIKYITV